MEKARTSKREKGSSSTRHKARAGVHYRSELLEDLEYAVDQSSAPTVFALFGFTNLKRYLDTILESDGDELLGRIAARLADAVGRQAVLYEPRRGEFGVLFNGDLATMQPVLERAAAAMNDETKRFGITMVQGLVELPAEGVTVAGALGVASARLNQAGRELRPTRRHSIYALVSSALGRSDELSKTAA